MKSLSHLESVNPNHIAAPTLPRSSAPAILTAPETNGSQVSDLTFELVRDGEPSPRERIVEPAAPITIDVPPPLLASIVRRQTLQAIGPVFQAVPTSFVGAAPAVPAGPPSDFVPFGLDPERDRQLLNRTRPARLSTRSPSTLTADHTEPPTHWIPLKFQAAA